MVLVEAALDVKKGRLVLRQLGAAGGEHGLDRHVDQVGREQAAHDLGAQHEAAGGLQPGEGRLVAGQRVQRRPGGGREPVLQAGVAHAGKGQRHVLADEVERAVQILARDVEKHLRHVGELCRRQRQHRRDRPLARDRRAQAVGRRRVVAVDQPIDGVGRQRDVAVGIVAVRPDLLVLQQLAVDRGRQHVALVARAGGQAGRVQPRDLVLLEVQAPALRVDGGKGHVVEPAVAGMQAELGRGDRSRRPVGAIMRGGEIGQTARRGRLAGHQQQRHNERGRPQQAMSAHACNDIGEGGAEEVFERSGCRARSVSRTRRPPS